MRKILFILAITIFSVFVFFAFSESRNGFLNKNISSGATEVYFGTETVSGRAYLWTDKKHGELYSDPQMTIQNGFTSDVDSLRFTGKKSKGFYEVAVSVKVNEGLLAPTLTESLREYEKKYYEQCSTCHAAAALNRFNKSRWENILKSMQQHSGISDEDLSAILRYIFLSITS